MNNAKTVYEVSEQDIDGLVGNALDRIGAYTALTDKANMLLKIEYLTAAQAANILGVRVETFRRYVRDKRIERRPGSETEGYAVSEIYKFLKRNGTKRKVGKDAKKA